jgi:hypothetical protein
MRHLLQLIIGFFTQKAPRGLTDGVVVLRARGVVEHFRPDASGTPMLLDRQVTYNLVTFAGRDFMHAQIYSTGPGANGLNYVALSNDAVTETTASTTLSNEIVANGLDRQIGAYSHTGGTNTTTISKTFTATGAQAAQKAALFTASSAGTMNHVLGFTQRSLQTNDTLAITFTLTVG